MPQLSFNFQELAKATGTLHLTEPLSYDGITPPWDVALKPTRYGIPLGILLEIPWIPSLIFAVFLVGPCGIPNCISKACYGIGSEFTLARFLNGRAP